MHFVQLLVPTFSVKPTLKRVYDHLQIKLKVKDVSINSSGLNIVTWENGQDKSQGPVSCFPKELS